MQFNSIEFIFGFLPLFLAVYLIFPQRLRNAVLILGSLGFYAFASSGKLWWVAVLAACTVLTYFAGLSLEKRRDKDLLTLYLSLMAGLLIFFKLYDGGRHLPAGMSFYLFQMAAYLIDTYRLKYTPEHSLLSFGAQMTLFPKLLSGPLMNPRQLQLQCRYCKPSYEDFHSGLQELILGLGLKVLLANRIGGLWSLAGTGGYEIISTPAAWMALIAYSMQLYFDFYGYSLMAMGLGRMLGYDLPRNFDDPYAAKTVSEFYRRWHVTLGAWFREYVYFPLGGSRRGTLRTILNLAAVWIFTGVWHGVGGNYLLWAGFLCALIICEHLWIGKFLKKTRVLCHVYTVFVILLSWVPFAVGDAGQMLVFLGRLFGLGGQALNPRDFVMWGYDYAGLLAAGVIFATPYPRKLWERMRRSTLADVVLLAVFWLVVYYISTAAQDPFLYFQY